MALSTAPKRSRVWLWLLVLFVFLPLGVCAPLAYVASRTPTVVAGTVLELDLESAISDDAGGFSLFQSDRHTLHDLVFALEKARSDPNVVGLVARVGGTGHGLGTAQEIHDAILAFRKSGKPTFAWADTIGEGGPGNGGYLLASSFDEIWLQPTGEVGVSGLFAETMFLKGAFDKLGLEAKFGKRKEFKNAVNQYTETDYTEPHREAMTRLLESAFTQIATSISTDRQKLGDVDTVRALLQAGPYGADDALKLGLVDKLGYRDEVMAAVKAKLGSGPMLYAHKYLERAGSLHDADGPVVALVTAIGPIMRGAGNVDPLSGGGSVGGDAVAAALRKATADDDVKAIVFRVDSPGGSAVASDTIWREVERAKAAGKHVVVSMGNVAGSGGYFVAMGADRIIAEPGTITGSIGVYSGKFVTTGLWDKLGVTNKTIALGDPSLYSSQMDYSEAARAKLEGSLDRIYNDFVGKAAKGRHMTFAELEPLAHGRIWSGSDALEKHLVDALGGYETALNVTRELLALPAGAPLRIREYPRPKSTLERLKAFTGSDGDNSDEQQAAMRARVVDVATAGLSRAAVLLDEPQSLSMPMFDVPTVSGSQP